MKTLNITFTDEEHEKLEKLKDASVAANWHDYFLLALGVVSEDELEKKKQRKEE